MVGCRPQAVSELISKCLRTIPPPVDWREILLELVRAGWRLRLVADAINAPPSTAQDWFNDGAQPDFEYTRSLLKLHAPVITSNRLTA
ncbi:MAG: hypothetical protein A3H97_00765 [Acidobacteria bacterium RIFCSPLOWO2_02_FULL_65_29]|nr:MAG: hypothetical protein A3H97_00765 [Acidobacteria bacterium RIFCSPLOWO2_02_FULL_65_29]